MLEDKGVVRVNCLQSSQLPLMLLVLLSGHLGSAYLFLLAPSGKLLVNLILKFALQGVQSKGIFDILRIYPKVLLFWRVERIMESIFSTSQPNAPHQFFLPFSIEQRWQLFQEMLKLLKMQIPRM